MKEERLHGKMLQDRSHSWIGHTVTRQTPLMDRAYSYKTDATHGGHTVTRQTPLMEGIQLQYRRHSWRAYSYKTDATHGGRTVTRQTPLMEGIQLGITSL